MKRLLLVPMFFAGALAHAQDPTFRAQLERLATQVRAELVAQDAIFAWMQADLKSAPEGRKEGARQTPAPPMPALSARDAALLRRVLERGARCVTGKLVEDVSSPLWVPEMKANCR